MTPLRAMIAGLIAAVLWGAGLFIATGFADGRPHDLIPLLSPGRTPFDPVCFFAAWGAFVAGALAVFAAFLAFIAPEEEDDPRFRRRGFPKAAPLVLIALSLGLAWYALHCAADRADPIPVAIAPQDEPAPTRNAAAPIGESTLTDAAPDAADEEQAIAPIFAPSEPPATPEPIADAARYQWTYKLPLVRTGRATSAFGADMFADDAEARRLLCGKAWIAVTGSASEEGPDGRNEERARMRARAAQGAATRWLETHDECGPTPVFGVSLGQHAFALGESEDGAATAYQRQVLVLSRAPAQDGAALTLAQARAELTTWLLSPENLATLYAGRRFASDPEIVVP